MILATIISLAIFTFGLCIIMTATSRQMFEFGCFVALVAQVILFITLGVYATRLVLQ